MDRRRRGHLAWLPSELPHSPVSRGTAAFIDLPAQPLGSRTGERTRGWGRSRAQTSSTWIRDRPCQLPSCTVHVPQISHPDKANAFMHNSLALPAPLLKAPPCQGPHFFLLECIVATLQPLLSGGVWVDKSGRNRERGFRNEERGMQAEIHSEINLWASARHWL